MKRSYFFLAILFVLVLDYFIKLWVVDNISTSIATTYPYGGLGVISNFFRVSFSLVHEVNRGAILGIFSDYPTPLLILRIGFCLFLTVYSLKRSRSFFEVLNLSLIIGGAVGNITDVFIYGHVIDMFKLVFGSFHYPVFNLADSAITVGAIGYFLIQFSKERYAQAS